MDHNLETLSDCSESSRNSESFLSDVSTSGLSEYKTEFQDLKKLVTSSTASFKKHSSSKSNALLCYEREIDKLNTELQKSLKQNADYKNEIIILEKKKDIFYSEKIDTLLKQSNHLKNNLSAANQQIQRLISIYSNKDDSTYTVALEKKNFELEKSNQEILNQNYLLSCQMNQIHFQKDDIENEYKRVKTEFNTLLLELSVKTNSTDELKKKISEQYLQIEQLCQSNAKLTHSLDLASNDLKHVRRSENWYKCELQRSHQEKNKVCQKMLEKDKIISLQEEKIEELKLELNSLKCTCDEIRLSALKEKENMLRQLESLDKDKITGNQTTSSDTNFDVENLTKHYESIVNELTNDVAKIKTDLEHQQKCLENVSKEKLEVLGKYLSLQNSAKEKDNNIEGLQIKLNELNEQLLSAVSKQKDQCSELLNVKKKCAKLEIELNLKIKENQMFEESVSAIKKQFKTLTSKHVQLKNEIFVRTKEIAQLKYEKQESGLSHCQETDELKRSIENNCIEIGNLNKEIVGLKKMLDEITASNDRQLKTIDDQNMELHTLRRNNNELQAKLKNSQFQHESSSHVLNVLRSICTFCKINDDDVHYKCVTDEEKIHFVNLLLNKIQSRFQFIEAQIASKCEADIERKEESSVLKRKVDARMAKLIGRLKFLEARNEENTKVLNALQSNSGKDCNSGDEIQRLQTLLEVKMQEAKDKQKRYERSYRTLLSKVKEHMKGRKAAERQNAYLQELHNMLSNECNTLQLQMDLKNSTIYELQTQLENRSRINEKLKLTVLKLENDLSLAGSCKQCGDLEMLKTAYSDSQQLLKQYESDNAKSILDLNLKDEFIAKLQKENRCALEEISLEYQKSIIHSDSLLQKNEQLCAKLDDFHKQLAEEQSISEHLKQDVVTLRNNCKQLQNENCQLTSRLKHLEEKNVHFQDEINHLNLCLQRKVEELKELQLKKENNLNRWQQQETNMQNVITGLKHQIHLFNSEFGIIKNEKFFLQRLCNDLKIALRTHVAQNKALRESLELVKRETIDNKNIILSNFPSPVKNDDVYIEKLLEESRMPFCDLQACVAKLRKEILYLQNLISEKNFV